MIDSRLVEAFREVLKDQDDSDCDDYRDAQVQIGWTALRLLAGTGGMTADELDRYDRLGAIVPAEVRQALREALGDDK